MSPSSFNPGGCSSSPIRTNVTVADCWFESKMLFSTSWSTLIFPLSSIVTVTDLFPSSS
uniref:Uncharacterized protein n=1 Tax=Lepeophtheirus salmonis TaxID=72036 RepID=A0A0K2URX2_LEPSM